MSNLNRIGGPTKLSDAVGKQLTAMPGLCLLVGAQFVSDSILSSLFFSFNLFQNAISVSLFSARYRVSPGPPLPEQTESSSEPSPLDFAAWLLLSIASPGEQRSAANAGLDSGGMCRPLRCSPI